MNRIMRILGIHLLATESTEDISRRGRRSKKILLQEERRPRRSLDNQSMQFPLYFIIA